MSKAERVRLARFKHFREEMMGYMHIQATRPKTLAYGLTDSPVGQLAWIVERRLPSCDSVNSRTWLFTAAQRPGMDAPPDCHQGIHGADESARVSASTSPTTI